MVLALAVQGGVGQGAVAQTLSPGLSPERQQFTLSFDVLAPSGLSCQAIGPGQIHNGTDVFGKPLVRIFGHADRTSITCQTASGQRYSTDVQRRVTYRPGHVIEAKVIYKTGSDAMTMLIDDGVDEDIMFRAFRRVDGHGERE